MPAIAIAPTACLASHSAMKTLRTPRQQRGMTLIELMIGMAIGLLVVAVAMASMMVSRSISGTVSDASAIQMQAAYAMRTIGGQLRQAGSLYLNPDPVGSAAADPLSAVIFETDATPASGLAFTQAMTVGGDETTGSLSTAFRRYKDAVFTASDPMALARNCLGGPADDSTDEAVQSVFTLNKTKHELLCSGNGTEQPILQNVAEFQVTYMQQVFDAAGSTIKYVTAADLTDPADWRSVQGVQVCLVLYGNESIDMPTGSEYTGCEDNDGDGQFDKVNITTLTGVRRNRMHLAFRNTFQLRSQGLL